MINFEDITQEIEYYLSHLNDDGFRVSIKYEILTPANIKVVLVKIWKGTDQLSYRSSDIFKFNEISDDIYRFIDNISNRFRFGYIYTMRRPKYWEDGFDDDITLYRQEYELEQVTKNDDLGQIKLFSMCLIPQSKVKESLNIHKFKDFISKYKKSQYISSNSIRRFNEQLLSIYDPSWEKLLPTELSIIKDKDKYSFVKGNVMLHSDMLQITYSIKESIFGFPDTLEVDIYFLKVDGKIKMDIDITLGDEVVSEFSIYPPNNVSVIQDTTIGSKFDPSNTIFAFDNVSLQKFVDFLNKFNHGLQLNIENFKFLSV
jgi:hypothetical protein